MQLQIANAEGNAEGRAAAEAELSVLGGRASYQAASELTTSKHRTSKWMFSLLTQMGLRPGKGQPPLKVLEVCSPGMIQAAAAMAARYSFSYEMFHNSSISCRVIAYLNCDHSG